MSSFELSRWVSHETDITKHPVGHNQGFDETLGFKKESQDITSALVNCRLQIQLLVHVQRVYRLKMWTKLCGDTDPDSGSEKPRYGSGSRPSFETNPETGKSDTDPDPGKKGFRTRKIFKFGIKNLIFHVFLFILLNYSFSIHNYFN